MKTKVCTKCSKELTLSCFSFRGDSGKYRNECKTCISVCQSRYREKTKESRKVYNRKYREGNREYLLSKDQERYAKDPEKYKVLSARHRVKNRSYYLEYNRRYYQNNKEKFFAANAQRRASQMLATPAWLDRTQKDQILTFYVHAKECGMLTGDSYHVDHIVPLQGENACGLHVPWNLQVLPSDLNLSKSNSFEGGWDKLGINNVAN